MRRSKSLERNDDMKCGCEQSDNYGGGKTGSSCNFTTDGRGRSERHATEKRIESKPGGRSHRDREVGRNGRIRSKSGCYDRWRQSDGDKYKSNFRGRNARTIGGRSHTASKCGRIPHWKSGSEPSFQKRGSDALRSMTTKCSHSRQNKHNGLR